MTAQPDHAALHAELHAELLIIKHGLASHVETTRAHIAWTEATFDKIASRLDQGNVLFERVSNSLEHLNDLAASGKADRDKMDNRLDLLERDLTERMTERRIAAWFLSWKPVAWLGAAATAFLAWIKSGGPS